MRLGVGGVPRGLRPATSAALARLTAAVAVLAGLWASAGTPVAGQPTAGTGFVIEATVPLGDISGRIDHLAVDLAGRLLFVAELGNGSVSAIDLATGTVVARATGLAEPQGVAFDPATRSVYVATGGDGMLNRLSLPDLASGPTVAIGPDADNVHLDPSGALIAVGFADGIALFDPAAGVVTASIALDGHAEGFTFDPTGTRIFVNVPEARQIAVVDIATASVIARWETGAAGENFPIAVDGDRVLIGLRFPGELRAFDITTGAPISVGALCEDSDDLFADPERGLVYVICGPGIVKTFMRSAEGYAPVAETRTAPGARTGLFVPELDRLFIAIPALSSRAAGVAILVPA